MLIYLKEAMKLCQTSCWIHFVIRVLEIKLTMEIVIYEEICSIKIRRTAFQTPLLILLLGL